MKGWDLGVLATPNKWIDLDWSSMYWSYSVDLLYDQFFVMDDVSIDDPNQVFTEAQIPQFQ